MIGGRLVKFIPQFSIVYTVSATLCGLMFFLIFWDTRPSYLVAFLVIAIWGICEGIWHSVPPSKWEREAAVKMTCNCVLFPYKKMAL